VQSEEEAVRAAAMRFYDAIEQMASGRGLDAMEQAWHHSDGVTSGHPSGDWAEGWDQVWATWQVFASFGAEGRGGTHVRDLKARVYGDVAYTTCTFIAAPAFGGERLACTNVLARIGGEWKVVHHHADKSLAMGAALEKLVGG
jgi:ketosteroid isomerase-like protein